MRDKQPLHSPEARLPAPRLADWGPTPETPAGRPHLKPRVGAHAPGAEASCPTHRPKVEDPRATRLRPRAADRLINGPAACGRTTPKSTGSEQLLPSPCAQSPAGPTGSLGGRQNTQQRGAAGLGETAFPGKTRPSRGLNYFIAAPRAPSI